MRRGGEAQVRPWQSLKIDISLLTFSKETLGVTNREDPRVHGRIGRIAVGQGYAGENIRCVGHCSCRFMIFDYLARRVGTVTKWHGRANVSL
jgi:hypothetical protein